MTDKPEERRKTARHAGSPKARPTIGYTSPDLSRYLSSMWAGALDVVQEQDVNLICFVCGVLRDTVDFKYQANVLLDMVSPENVDGLIFNTTNLAWYMSSEETKDFIERLGLPTTSIGLVEGTPSIAVECASGMRELVSHLIEVHGYRRIALIRGPEGHPEAESRYNAYAQTLAEHNIPLDPNLVTPPYLWTDDWKRSSVDAIRCLLDERKLRPKVDLEVIIGNNDASAISAMELLRERRIQVPLDVAVVGFDDHEISRSVTPSLSTVHQPIAQQSRWAAETLLTQLEGKPLPEQVVVPTTAIIRQSCGCLDRVVAQAKADRPTTPGKGFAAAFAAGRKEILSDIASAVGPAADLIPEQIERLLEAFAAEVKGEAPGAFLPALEEVLRLAATAGGDAAVWQQAISVLHRHALPCFADGEEALFRAENLWQQARLAIGETARRTQAYRRLQTEQQTQILHELGQALITASDVAGLMDVLARALPGLGIPACYLSLYEDPSSPADWSRLMLAYDERGRVELETDGRRFPSRQLVPDGMLPQERRYTIVVEPLYSRETQLGFVLFETAQRESMVYDALRAQISSALKNILLTRQIQRRALQLQTAAEVSRAASSVLNLDELLPQAVDLIRERFNLYYAGLFLVDEAGEWTGEPGKWAVLRAGTGEAGRRQLEIKHKLEIGGASMIGQCVASKQARIALDVGKEAVRFDNPHLPETRSELALPLISRDRIIGALTIQSTRQAAFSDEDIVVLQTMADQLANAIENAHLFAERLQVEQRLAAERNLLRTLIDNLEDYVYIKDRQSRFVINNTAHLRVMGLKTQEEALGKTDFDFFPQELAAQYYADEQTLMQTGQALKAHEETVIDQTTGAKQWVSSTKAPLHNVQGDVIGFVGFTQDITERKAYEAERERLLAEAQQSEHLLRSIIDATPDWIFVKDRRHRYRLVNRSYATDLHLVPDEFIGKDDVEIGFPEDIVKGNSEKGIRGFWADDRQVMDSGEPLVNPHVPVTIDGQMHIFHDVKTPLRDATGHVWGVLGLGRDVTEREQLLADLERHSTELQAAAEISRAASSILDPGELTRRAVDLIRERLGLYYVGLFLVEEIGKPGKWAVLQAGTGEAGRHMLESKHRLEVGGASMVGWCVANKQARIALDVGEEAVRFDNPHLPETRSELALPLISQGEAIGALTIQSAREAAFTEEDITTLQTMADQLANAVQNARLLERTQAALAEVEATQRRYLQQAWTTYAQAAKSTSYEAVRPGADPLGEVVLPEIQQAIEQRHATTSTEGGDGEQRRSALVAPIALRGEVIGVLGVHDDGVRQWTDGEVALIEAVAERMAQTAENLRLLDETQRRVQREQTLREITARVRGATDPDTVVRTALRELGTTLGRPAFVRLGNAEQLSSPPTVTERGPAAVSGRSPAAVSGRSPAAVSGRSPAAVSGRSPAAVSGQDSAPAAEQGLKPVEETQPSAPPTGRRRRGNRKSK
jgi:PAS domain S-box-containing protein